MPRAPAPPACMIRTGKNFSAALIESVKVEVVERMRTGETLTHILDSDPDRFPSYSTILYWTRKDDDFADTYHQAKKDQAEVWLDMAIDHATLPPWHLTLDAELKRKIENNLIVPSLAQALIKAAMGADMQHRKLKLDVFKWYASKMHPQRYGTQTDKDDKDGQQSIASVQLVQFER